MIKINKKASPVFFDNWKINFLLIKGGVLEYSDLIGDEKQKIREELYEEQLGVCCYCCKRIAFPYTNSIESHIEHFRPKGEPRYAALSLEYSNLHLSCSGYKSCRDSCGHKKDNWYDEILMISPLEEDVEKHFEYSVDGHIKATPKNDRADATITNLELDSFNLQRQRKTAIYVSGLIDEDFDEEKRKMIITEYSTTEDGALKSFCNAVLYCAQYVA